MAVIACILAMVQAGAVFVFARSSGDGLFYSCCHQCMAMNVDPNAAVGGGGGGAWGGQQQQPQPVSRKNNTQTHTHAHTQTHEVKNRNTHKHT